jgi:ribosomal protein L23
MCKLNSPKAYCKSQKKKQKRKTCTYTRKQDNLCNNNNNYYINNSDNTNKNSLRRESNKIYSVKVNTINIFLTRKFMASI